MEYHIIFFTVRTGRLAKSLNTAHAPNTTEGINRIRGPTLLTASQSVLQ